LLVALEDFELHESADEGDDVLVSFKLKQFKEYGVKTVKVASSKPSTTSTSNKPRSTDNKTKSSQSYTVKSGDCLWSISKKFYGDGAKWTTIYNANKNIIETTAEKHRGKGKGSSNGHWIYPGTNLTIPAL
jgi:nucleoid-associated protein YgaU